MTILEKVSARNRSNQQENSIQSYSLVEFEALLNQPENSNRLLELIDGEIFEKMPTQQHGLVASNVNFALVAYARMHK